MIVFLGETCRLSSLHRTCASGHVPFPFVWHSDGTTQITQEEGEMRPLLSSHNAFVVW